MDFSSVDPRLRSVVKVRLALPNNREALLGTGFLLGEGKVLTARHVIKNLTDDDTRNSEWWTLNDHPIADLRVAPAGAAGRGWPVTAASQFRHDEKLDATVLSVPAASGIFGHCVGATYLGVEPLHGCRLVGFPIAATDNESIGVEQIRVTLNPISGESSGLIAFDIESAQPAVQEGWKGISGAGIIDRQGRLLGLANSIHRRFQGRLFGTGVDRIKKSSALEDRDELKSDWRSDSSEPSSLEHLAKLPIHRFTENQLLFEAESTRSFNQSSLFSLIQQQNKIVEFVEDSSRRHLLKEILKWAEGKSNVAPSFEVMLLTGPAGAGKSRLAAEVCERLKNAAEWQEAGFMDLNRIYEGARVETIPQIPMFSVFDYADQSPELIGNFLSVWKRIEANGGLHSNIRVLLISRNYNDWLARLLGKIQDGEAIPIFHRQISSNSFDEIARRSHFNAAFEAFSRHFGTPIDPIPELDLDSATYDRPLTVHIAAILASIRRLDDSQRYTGPEIEREDAQSKLLSDFIWREGRRWVSFRSETGQPAFYDRTEAMDALCVVALTAPSLSDLPELLKCTISYQDASLAERRRVARAIYELYPNEPDEGNVGLLNLDYLNAKLAPIEPDLIAAQLVYSVPDRRSLITNLAMHPIVLHNSEYLTKLLKSLTLAADEYEAVNEDLKLLLSIDRQNILETPLLRFIDASVPEANEKHGAALVAAIVSTVSSAGLDSDPEVDNAAGLIMVLCRLPMNNPALSSLGVILSRREITMWKRIGGLEELARAHISHASWLGNDGQHNLAVDAAQQAVAIFRALAEDNRQNYLSEWANSVNSLAIAYHNTNRDSEALTEIRLAVSLYEELVELDRSSHLEGFAMTKSNLSNALGEIGEHDEALLLAEQAFALFTELSEGSECSYQDDIAMTMNNLANVLFRSNRVDESVELMRSAVSIYEELVSNDRIGYLADLAMSLYNLAENLVGAGEYSDAFESAERSIDLYRELCVINRRAYIPVLLTPLRRITIWYAECGRVDDSLRNASEALSLSNDLIEIDRSMFLPELYGTLVNASLVRGFLNVDVDAAIIDLDRAVAIATEISHTDESFNDNIGFANMFREHFIEQRDGQSS
ncbi:tetratricopeptide repeat protein [Glycomyces sp. NPDC047010]|uniref:tetratricopeptide repeat protein n=1 Tax=Glycomyces sp. NPDC047010 TaxID=3155023 RepID=UPI0033F3148C